MALAAASRGTPLSSTANTTAYTMTDGGTPGANRLLLAIVGNSGPGTNPDSFTGYGLTWVRVGTNTTGVLAFYAALTGASPSSTAPVATWNSGATGAFIHMIEITGAYISGSVLDAFVQQSVGVYIVENGTAGVTSGSLTYNAADQSANRPLAAFRHATSEQATPRTNWTELTDGNYGTPAFALEVQWRSDAFETTGSATWSTSSGYVAMGVEIKEAAAYLIAKSSSDSGAGTDAESMVATGSSSDTGTGTDTTSSMVAAASSSDSGAGTEGTPTLAATLSSADTGTGAEGTPTLAATLSGSDTATGTEGTPALTASVGGSDSGTGTEGTPALAATLSSSDTAAGTEGTPAVAASLGGSDSGVGTDAGAVATLLGLSDSGVGLDAEQLASAIASAETALVGELEAMLATAAASETGVGSETEDASEVSERVPYGEYSSSGSSAEYSSSAAGPEA